MLLRRSPYITIQRVLPNFNIIQCHGPGITNDRMNINHAQEYFTQRRNPTESPSPSSRANSPSIGPLRHRSEEPFHQERTNRSVTPQSTSRSILALSRASIRSEISLEQRPGPQYFHSRRIQKGQVVKPWTVEPRDPREKWITIIPLIGLFVGLCAAGLIIWDGIRSVVNHKYCMVLDEDWSQGFRPDIWQPEIQVGGFG